MYIHGSYKHREAQGCDDVNSERCPVELMNSPNFWFPAFQGDQIRLMDVFQHEATNLGCQWVSAHGGVPINSTHSICSASPGRKHNF